MRQMGLAMEARRLSRLQREEIKAEVLGLAPAAEPRIGGVRRIAR
jgi:hypothetical protein